MDWTEQMAGVDADVDAELGDTFQFAPMAGQPFVTMNGFANPEDWADGAAPLDLTGDQSRQRVKIAMAILPVVTTNMRFIVPQLKARGQPADQKWRPENWQPSTKGRYWLIDLQKAST